MQKECESARNQIISEATLLTAVRRTNRSQKSCDMHTQRFYPTAQQPVGMPAREAARAVGEHEVDPVFYSKASRRCLLNWWHGYKVECDSCCGRLRLIPMTTWTRDTGSTASCVWRASISNEIPISLFLQQSRQLQKEWLKLIPVGAEYCKQFAAGLCRPNPET